MQIHLDNPKLSLMKNGSKALSFSVILDSEGHQVVISNFRLMDGIINPPVFLLKRLRQYTPIVFLSESAALEVYNQICASPWVTQYELPDMQPCDVAIEPLVLTAQAARRVAPAMVGA